MKLNNNLTPSVGFQQPKTAAKAPNFQGNLSVKAKDFFKSQRAGNMAQGLFVLNAFTFLLSGRLFTSRDKDEVRETAVRDIPTIFIAVFGVNVVEKFAAAFLHKKGMPICNQDEKGKLSAASYSQLNDWYTYDKNIANGFESFTKRLTDKTGNLKKIFSKLGDDVKNQIAGFSDDNDKFILELNKNKDLKNKVIEAFSSKQNKALKEARWMRTVPTIAGFLVTLGVVGYAIPKSNIKLTEHIQRKREHAEKHNK